MPCYTKVMVTLPTDKYTLEARRKLGIREKGDVTEEEAVQIRIEAGKLKTATQIRALNPGAMIQGLQIGVKKLTIQINI